MELQTERMSLRKITPELIHHYFNTLGKQQIMELLGLEEAEYSTYRQMHEEGMETFRLTMLYFLLIRKADGSILGNCGFHTWNKTHHRAELFYALKRDEDKGQGYLTEVLPLVLAFGFSDMGLHRIEACVAARNTPSVRLLQRQGFVQEGTLREHYLVDDVYEDSDVYALISRPSGTRAAV